MERSEAIFNLGSEVVMSAQCGNYDTLNYAIIQERLDRCLIDPINTERFENYSNAQAALRKHEIDNAKRIMQE